MKKLNIAFIWHFHQPSYQENFDGEFLLPWVRLHATKDYLDMLKRMDKFPRLKLNFDFSPILLSSLQKYSRGLTDTHYKLLTKKDEELSEDDKIFILNNYFDLNYKNMVLQRPSFAQLYNKRVNAQSLDTSLFNSGEYSDIMANFTLCWIDKSFVEDYPELTKLFKKEKNYTLKDRQKIAQIQLDIINRILVEYKKYQDDKKIEITISPFYHPIMPLLLGYKNKGIKNMENLPIDFARDEYAKAQIDKSIEKYQEIFNTKPKGMWLSEQCICQDTAKLLSQKGILWSISDEGILSKSIKTEFARDFEGNLENPFKLTTNYITKGKAPLNLLFSDSFFANLLNFGYGNYDSKVSANDMYEKIKVIQSKLQNSPKENHILTIALDGENCWETYSDDGSVFLDTLYDLISSDETLETVCVSDFIKKNKGEPLSNLSCGSWINRNFDFWIGEPTKNVAWYYQTNVIKDFEKFRENAKKAYKELSMGERKVFDEKIYTAFREILISQSSDWYWWYGEPNESRSDKIFDYLFRAHLINVYKILGMEIPEYLLSPLTSSKTRSLRKPLKEISPTLSCTDNDELKEWENAGFIFIPDSPVSNVTRIIKNIYFGHDKEYAYFRFEFNKNSLKMNYDGLENQIAIYFTNKNEPYCSPIRFVNKNENIYPILQNQFTKEARFIFGYNKNLRFYFNKACGCGLWSQVIPSDSKIACKNVVELKISFKDLEMKKFSFCIIESTNEMINEVYPQDVMINL